jgi:hypothetical protein
MIGAAVISLTAVISQISDIGKERAERSVARLDAESAQQMQSHRVPNEA